MSEIELLVKEIEDSQRKLTILRERQRRLQNNDTQAVADYLHKTFCRWNHTDGCSYEYEVWGNSTAQTKGRWHAKAVALIRFKDTYKTDGTITDLIDFLKTVTTY